MTECLDDVVGLRQIVLQDGGIAVPINDLLDMLDERDLLKTWGLAERIATFRCGRSLGSPEDDQHFAAERNRLFLRALDGFDLAAIGAVIDSF